MKLTDFIVTDAIITEIKSTRKEDVIREMVDALKNAQEINDEEVERFDGGEKTLQGC